MPEIRTLTRELKGKKIHRNVKLVAVTTKFYRDSCREMGYESIIRESGGILTDSMCIAFAGSHLKDCTIATDSIKGAFFFSGFSQKSRRQVYFGAIEECVNSAIKGHWEGSVTQ
jgi:predicted aconitase